MECEHTTSTTRTVQRFPIMGLPLYSSGSTTSLIGHRAVLIIAWLLSVLVNIIKKVLML